MRRLGAGREAGELLSQSVALSEIRKPEQRWPASPARRSPPLCFHCLLLWTGVTAAPKDLVLDTR